MENQTALGEVYLGEKFVFIGRNLDEKEMRKGLRTVLYEYNGNTTSENSQKWLERLCKDYAISGGWNYNGEVLIICDAAGGIYVFDGKSGEVIWSQGQVHEGGILSAAIHPLTDRF